MLLVDKPAGMTSHDVVDRVRRALGTRRVGHTGTLDPFATGLLVMLVGRATRLAAFIDGEPKVYEATIRFGAETSTDDVTGDTTRTAPPPNETTVDAAIRSLTGSLLQLPPAYSAKKVDGRRAYKVARRGEALALEPATVHVHSWIVKRRRTDEIDATIECGGGTYVRALARDLGRLAGSAAHLVALRRVRSGPFRVDDALGVAELDGGGVHLRPMRAAIPSMATQEVRADELGAVLHGRELPARATGGRIAIVDAEGDLVAIMERQEDRLRPLVVLGNG